MIANRNERFSGLLNSGMLSIVNGRYTMQVDRIISNYVNHDSRQAYLSPSVAATNVSSGVNAIPDDVITLLCNGEGSVAQLEKAGGFSKKMFELALNNFY